MKCIVQNGNITKFTKYTKQKGEIAHFIVQNGYTMKLKIQKLMRQEIFLQRWWNSNNGTVIAKFLLEIGNYVIRLGWCNPTKLASSIIEKGAKGMLLDPTLESVAANIERRLIPLHHPLNATRSSTNSNPQKFLVYSTIYTSILDRRRSWSAVVDQMRGTTAITF